MPNEHVDLAPGSLSLLPAGRKEALVDERRDDCNYGHADERGDSIKLIQAVEIVQRRELLLRRLRQRGVLAIELMPGALAASLVNQYLDIKDRSLI